MITLSIDGQPVEAPAGSTILHAARLAGVEIPTICCTGAPRAPKPEPL